MWSATSSSDARPLSSAAPRRLSTRSGRGVGVGGRIGRGVDRMPGPGLSRSVRAALPAAAVIGLGGAALAAEAVNTIDTPGQGHLIMCRDWLVYTSCWSYHHVAIPARIKTGDSLD